ncbi:Co2+/Mg2+ efflux protein ApaG [Bdellovibrio bacteriovorus]|nr:Co2+/Mg2+ efflux protein ApaG [Bdellovibrio bacteriovorus]
MAMQKTETRDFSIKVNVVYVSQESKPDQNYHFFAYKISITNNGSSPAQLMSRFWLITDSHGHKEEVRGPGVVGVQPKIQPGQTFEYESACPLHASTGSMKGHYQFVAENGESFTVEIPEFYLIAPIALH